MEKIVGYAISEGIAMGNAQVLRTTETEEMHLLNVARDKYNFSDILNALHVSVEQLKQLQLEFDKKTNNEDANFLMIQCSILEDTSLISFIQNQMEVKAEDAVDALTTTCFHFKQKFLNLNNAYMRERAKDVEDAILRVRNNLLGIDSVYEVKDKSIIFCMDLTPSETAQLDMEKVLAIVTEKGTNYSHMAIMARMLDVPAITGVSSEMYERLDREYVIVDGYSGEIYINPNNKIIEEYRIRQQKDIQKKEELKIMLGKPARTKKGKTIKLFANIASEKDVEQVLMNKADGIGLLRSEFIYMNRSEFPTEDEQYEIYKNILERMGNRQVVIRTVDMGADKAVDYFQLAEEENPAIGYRGIRICLKQKEMFKTQLRALVRASKYGKLCIMFPMISDIEEIIECKKIIEDVKLELKSRQYEIGDFQIGIMVETPAAAIESQAMAKEVDFFSIGTNDLTQFTLAIDRMNPQLEGTYNRFHPAVLKLIEMTVNAAKREGIWVGVCGEMASEKEMAKWFIDIGITELSVPSSNILSLKKAISEI